MMICYDVIMYRMTNGELPRLNCYNGMNARKKIKKILINSVKFTDLFEIGFS